MMRQKSKRQKQSPMQSPPAWAQRDRLADLAWIADNLDSLGPAARQQFQLKGRGAVVVDTTVRMIGAGHPFAYLPLAEFDETHDADARRMAREYRPEAEMVIVLLKAKRRVSVYRCFHSLL